jgi:hypothetical protein
MERHAFDGISFFFGLLFVTLASWVLLTDGALDLVDARWVWPVLFVVGGIALLVPTFRRAMGGSHTAPPPFDIAEAEPGRDEVLERAEAELPPDPFGAGS